MSLALEVINLSKEYRIGAKQERYYTLRDTLVDVAVAPFRRVRNLWRGSAYGAAELTESLWALRDVSFSIEHGDVVGIIGRNGAGKSTLLKVLSQITEPTRGQVRLYGRVGALLEVGTGFHTELTGRENIYLNGAILGMSRAEIERKFDEIVDFAGVEKFIDTPVKHYSSGMGLRLGFAVAAHLEPDILIVDEVLAVGDAEFQKKCLGKMSDVAGEGRTVLFVSHNMGAVEHLCKKGIVLSQGQVRFIGTQTEAIQDYLSFSRQQIDLSQRTDRSGNGDLRVTHIEIQDATGHVISEATCGQAISIHLHYEMKDGASVPNVIPSVSLETNLGQPVFLGHSRLVGKLFNQLPSKGEFVIHLPALNIAPTSYRLSYSIQSNNTYTDRLEDAFELTVLDGNFYGSGEVPPATHGLVLLAQDWQVEAHA